MEGGGWMSSVSSLGPDPSPSRRRRSRGRSRGPACLLPWGVTWARPKGKWDQDGNRICMAAVGPRPVGAQALHSNRFSGARVPTRWRGGCCPALTSCAKKRPGQSKITPGRSSPRLWPATGPGPCLLRALGGHPAMPSSAIPPPTSRHSILEPGAKRRRGTSIACTHSSSPAREGCGNGVT